MPDRRRRSLIGSDIIILFVCLAHVVQGVTLLTTGAANNAVAPHALIGVFILPKLAAVALFVASLCAAAGCWLPLPRVTDRFLLLLPQFSMLMVPALGAVVAIAYGHYPSCVEENGMMMLSDQMPRIVGPFMYLIAVEARIG